jgi:hypothetical protein
MGDLKTIVERHSIIIPYTIPAGVYRKKPKILLGKKPIETDKDTIIKKRLLTLLLFTFLPIF